MKNLYNFYVKLDRYNWYFDHYKWAWKNYKPKEKYTLGNQLTLLIETPIVAFLNSVFWLYEMAKKTSIYFSLNGKGEKVNGQ